MTDAKERCERAEWVAGYALRALPASEAEAVEEHLRGCEACRDELAEMRAVVDAFVEWPTDVLRPPAPLWDRLASRIGASHAAAPRTAEARWADEPEWRAVAPGISCKVLSKDEAKDTVAMLVRLAPKTAYPSHVHGGVEELHLLDGELWIEDRKLLPGDYNRGEPETTDHRVYSETGCTCVLITSNRDVFF
jgi:anti-sigma factor ChrR (cupin superfamily)